jgi:hypothetical protein
MEKLKRLIETLQNRDDTIDETTGSMKVLHQ